MSRAWAGFLVGCVVALVGLAVINGRFPTITAPILSNDIDQHRIDTALPALADGLTIEQTFVPQRDALTAVSLTAVVYEGIESDPQSRVTFALFNDAGDRIAVLTQPTSQLTHNQTIQLNFDPVPNAKGKQFTIRASSDGNTAVSLWGYSLNTHSAGQLTLSDSEQFTFAKTLRFTTQYQLTMREAVQQLGRTLRQEGAILLLALLVVPLPGALALRLYKPSRRWDWGARWGTAVALGCALWPLLWAALTLLGGRWNQTGLWMVVVGGWLVYWGLGTGDWGLGIGGRGSGIGDRRPAVHNSQFTIHNSQLLLLLLSSLAVRLLTVRDLHFPLWVDASRHGLITAVMQTSGQTISNYQPYLPIDSFPYHFGFHTLSASLMLMGEFPLERLLLIFGQLLNGLVPLSIYAAVWLLTRRRGSALFAAFLVAFPFYFPGYYVTWGRFTQLTGVVILPVLLALTWLLVRGARGWRNGWWLVGVLAAGLFFVHFRVFVLYVPFALLVWPLGWWCGRRWALVWAGVLTAVFTTPRAFSLWQQARATVSNAGSNLLENYNEFPTGYYTAGWDEHIIWVAFGIAPLLVFGMWARRRWGWLPLALLVWVNLLLLFVWFDPLGIARRGVINFNSLYIILFVPLALYLGLFFEQFRRQLRQLPTVVQSVGWGVIGALLVVLLLFGTRTQLTIINPATRLARPADRAGLAWLDKRLDQDAQIAVGSWLWLGNTWAGQDGGAWLVPLFNRNGSTPPADYIYDLSLVEQVSAFNETAVSYQKEEWAQVETAVWLQEQGITHVFVGAGGSFFDPATLAQNAGLELLYSEDGVFVFGVKTAVP